MTRMKLRAVPRPIRAGQNGVEDHRESPYRPLAPLMDLLTED